MSQYTEFVAGPAGWVPLEGDPTEFVATATGWVAGVADVVTPPPAADLTLTEVPDLVMLLDARTPTAAVGTEVTSWTDPVSGRAFTADTATPGITAPTMRVDPNGRRFLRFNGRKDRLTLSGTVLPATGAYTMYALVRMACASTGTIFQQGSTTKVGVGYHLSCYGPNDIRGMRWSDDGTITRAFKGTIVDSWQVVAVRSETANTASIRVQEQPGTLTPPTSNSAAGVATTNIVTIGTAISRTTKWLGDHSDFSEVDVAALIVCDKAHDDATIASVEKTLAAEFQVVLPSQGGSIHNVAEVRARRLDKNTQYGLITTHPDTGAELAGFHNTGVDPAVELTRHTGTFVTSSTNQVVRGLRINGNVEVNHAGVVFEDCIVFTGNDPKVGAGTKPAGSLVTYRRCEVGGADEDASTAVGYNRYLAENCWVHDNEDGFRLGNQVTVRRCLSTRLTHGILYENTGERLHADDSQSTGCDNPAGEWTTVEFCNFPSIRDNGTRGNSAVILNNEQNYTRRIRIRENMLGGGSYTLYVTANPYYAEAFEITNNVFDGKNINGDIWLQHDTQDGFCTLTGNRRLDGQPLEIYRTTVKEPDRVYNGATPTPLPVSG